ncbi:MAG: tetratricopeptide repeat protein [Armatimonadota bacterium]
MTDQTNQPDIQNKIELQLRQAILQQMRGELVEAQKACVEILKLQPRHVEALELMGDLLCARGDTAHAIIAYRQAKDNSVKGTPAYASAERKWATLLYEQSLPEHDQSEVRLSPAIAMVLSLMLPGVAHLWMRQFTKAGIMIGCGMVLTTLLLFSPWGINDTLTTRAITTGPVLLSFLLMSVAFTAAIDAYQIAAGLKPKAAKPVHPALPEEVRNNPDAKP